MKRLLTATCLLAVTSIGHAQTCEDNSNSTAINAIQGSALSSKRVGETVSVIGVANSDWTAAEQLGGFFLQSLPNQQDNDPSTAEGLFIATENSNDTVAIGERIHVTGTVAEVDGLTALVNVSELFSCGAAAQSITPERLTMPFDSVYRAEALEGMKVIVDGDQPLTISGHYPLARYGIFDVSAGRLMTPTQVARPGSPARAQAQSNALNRLQVDDNRSQPPTTLPHSQLFHGPQNSLRSGATVKPMTGVLSQYRDEYQLQPTEPVALSKRSRITPIQPKYEEQLRIASFNVLNYFNGDGQGGGFPTPRGADTPEQLARQQQKIISALDAIDADVIGLMEVENDGFTNDSAIVQLVSALNDAQSINYAIAQPRSERVGNDQISVAIIYNSARLTPASHALTLTDGPFQRGSRVPLAQVFNDLKSDQSLTVVVNHFKSKGSCPESGPNARHNDGQACWNKLRLESSQRLVDWLQQKELPAAVLLGDFNAYYQEDPLRYLTDNGYRNVSDPGDYSYVYDSQAGSLDHLFVADELAASLTVQHINFNADEPIAYDYRDPDYYQPGPYRSSDHDPLLLDLSWAASEEDSGK